MKTSKSTTLSFTGHIPLWAVISGSSVPVQLLSTFDENADGLFIYPAGKLGVLEGMAMNHLDGARGMVVFPEDPSCIVEIPFHMLCPVELKD